jgi:hypothetical protein
MKGGPKEKLFLTSALKTQAKVEVVAVVAVVGAALKQ